MFMQQHVDNLVTDQEVAQVYEVILGYGFGAITLSSVIAVLVHWLLMKKSNLS